MKRLYASRLTKEFLQANGITDVTKDGHVFKGDREVFPFWIVGKRPYLGIILYERDENGHLIKGKDRVYKRKRADGSVVESISWQAKQRTFGLHRLIWAWHYGEVPEGMVVDHIDNKHETLYDYRLENLQLLSPRENLIKDNSKFELGFIKCKINKPRSFYEEKLLRYEEEYEKAKIEHDTEKAHKLRSSISQTRARLRYWDAHQGKHEEIMKENKRLTEEKLLWKQNISDRKLLAEYKKMFKESGNKAMWHQMCKVINAWDGLDSIQKEHIFDCLHKFF